MEQDNNKKENLLEKDIVQEMEVSFIDYAMSVIVSRAIPDIRDGLKPVHRRILYAMYGLDMQYNKSFKKSAKVVGEVIAKYHPHGDSSVYDAMVRLAQPFSMRYPLVWGQGNFGSIDGDSAAAMRYTEAKLTKTSSYLLDEIKKDTVDFQENYDGSEQEPKVLPSKLPNILLNGSTGIAVGMATSIPPHNIVEVLKAAKELAQNPELEINDLMEYIKGPDFPTSGIIINKNELLNAYSTGRGRVVIRSRTTIEFNENTNRGKIIITEIPYMVNKSALILKIADLVRSKTLTSISDIKDESNRRGIRVVISLKKGFIPDVELNKLFKLTPLQSSFPINMIALVNERPETLSLKTTLEHYINQQIVILIRKTKFLLDKAEKRKHILEGLQKALNHIDAIIEIIKKSNNNNEAIENLMSKYNFSEAQTKAILDMKLQRLTGLERDNLNQEIENLIKDIENYNRILNSRTEQIKEINKQIDELIKIFGDERRTEVSTDLSGDIDDEDLIPNEDVIITLTSKGYVKRIPVKEYRSQNKGGQGSRGITINEDDYVTNIISTNTHTDLLLFSSYGKVYRLRALNIPQYGKTAKGIPIINILKTLEKEEIIRTCIPVSNYEGCDFFFVTKNGVVKKTKAIEFSRINKNGKRAIGLKDHDILLGVKIIPTDQESMILMGNSNGKAIKFPSTAIRAMGRTASGVRGMNVDKGKVVDFASSKEGVLVLSLSEKGFAKLTSIDEYRLINRGGKGVLCMDIKKAGKVIALKVVHGNEDLMIVTNKGTIIRTKLSQLSELNRKTKGSKIITLKPEERISSAEVLNLEETISDSDKKHKIEKDDINIKEKEQEEKDEQKLDKAIKELTSEFNVDEFNVDEFNGEE